jgi:O-antigen ligase
MFKDRPILGHGYHSYGSVIQKYLSSEESKLSFPRDSHSMYLDMLAGTGILGTITFIYFLWSCIRLVWKLFSKGSWSDEIQIWILASWGGLTAFLVAGLFDRHFYMPQTLVPFLFFLGGISAISMGEASAKIAKGFPPDPN